MELHAVGDASKENTGTAVRNADKENSDRLYGHSGVDTSSNTSRICK